MQPAKKRKRRANKRTIEERKNKSVFPPPMSWEEFLETLPLLSDEWVAVQDRTNPKDPAKIAPATILAAIQTCKRELEKVGAVNTPDAFKPTLNALANCCVNIGLEAGARLCWSVCEFLETLERPPLEERREYLRLRFGAIFKALCSTDRPAKAVAQRLYRAAAPEIDFLKHKTGRPAKHDNGFHQTIASWAKTLDTDKASDSPQSRLTNESFVQSRTI